MNRLAKHIIIKLITFFMIGVMGMFIANRVIFLHAHKLNDGTIVAHAHPYDKSNDSKPYKSHHHSNADFLFLQNLEILFPVFFLTLALIAIVKIGQVPFILLKEHILIFINLHKGRAPPIS